MSFLIALQRMGGQRPRLHARKLEPWEAQVAVNCKLWQGTLAPWYPPLLAQTAVKPGPIRSIYRFSDAGYWLHWNTDVDVVRGPIAGSQRLYWTGDGVPKFGNAEVIAGVTTLTQAAGAGQNFVIVGNTRGFKVGHNIRVALDSGLSHNTVITTIQASLNRLNLQFAIPTVASVGKAVTNNDQGYPHGFYAMGVPAPTNAPTAVATAGANEGTVVGLTGPVGEGSGSSTTANASFYIDVAGVNGQGELLDFQIDATFQGQLASVQTQPVTIRVYRDPAGVNEKIYETITQTTFQGPAAGSSGELADPTQVYWTGSEYLPLPGAAFTDPTDGGAPVNTADNHPHFQYTPAAGAQTYRLEISHTFVPTFTTNWTYNLRLSVRKNQEMGVILNTTAHGLREGDHVQFGGIVGTGTVSDLNKGPLVVLRTEAATVFVDTEANGTYTSGGTWAQVWDPADLETRAYVYTYVASIDGVDMEGPPSLPSGFVSAGDNQSITLSGFIDPLSLADDRPYRAMRVYRTATGDETDAEWLFVMELALPSATAIDALRGTQLGEVLPSETWEPPPADLAGLFELPNGGLAGFRLGSNELCLSVPYMPHAWPIESRYTMPDTIVAGAAFGSSIAVTSKGRPNVLTGSDPIALSREHIEITHPCLSKRGLVDMGYGIVYPTETGLCYIAQGVATIITRGLFTDDQWKALNPSSFVAAMFGERYLCFYDTGLERGGFILDPKEPDATLSFLDVYGNEAWSDPRTGKLYLVRVSSTGAEEIAEWNADKTGLPLTYRWRSKEFIHRFPVAARALKVDSAQYPVQITLIADGQVYDSIDVQDGNAVRVSDKQGKARKWEVEAIGTADAVEAVYVSDNMETITQYLGG